MKMNQIPKISITQDFSTNDQDDLDANECTANIQDAHTDIENFDSDVECNDSKKNLLKARKKLKSKKIDQCATDVEDCVGSGSDDESDLSKVYDARLSLNEFLDQGFVDETSSFGGTNKVKHSRHVKNAGLLVPQEDDGAITDCEDLYGSDNDIDDPVSTEMVALNRKFNDFLIDNDDFSSVDVQNSALVHLKKLHNRHMDVSDNECNIQLNNWNELSDVENMEFSEQEGASNVSIRFRRNKSPFEAEEMTLALSDIEDSCKISTPTRSHQEIAVSFVNRRSKRTRNTLHALSLKANKGGNSLTVQKKPEEAITDVENLESSDDEKINMRKTLSIPMALVNATNNHTDLEDFDADDLDMPDIAADIKLPSPSREIIVSKEDKHGDPVSKMMPLVASSNGFLSVTGSYVDKGLTDTEDMSGNEDEYINTDQYAMSEMPAMENDFISSSEGLTNVARNNIVFDLEPVTDVEDMKAIGGSKLRRRKSKPKSNKPKSILLSVQRQHDVEAITDNEEILLSDEQAAKYYNPRFKFGAAALEPIAPEDGTTDIEEISDDEEFHNKSNAIDIDPNVFRQETFFSTITLSDASPSKSLQHNQGYSKISTIMKTREAHDSSADIGTTDVEEMIHSDAEDFLGIDKTPQRNINTPNELRCAFNESLSSHVYDQSKSEFNTSNEGQHVKRFANIQDAHTDIECLDDEKSEVFFYRIISSIRV